jgi:tetratricopeptide (TPR) repeat protein
MTGSAKIYLSLIIAIVCWQGLHAQGHNIFSNFRRIEKRADNYFNHHSYAPALHLYEKVFAKDSLNERIILKVAECYRLLNHSKESEIWYAKVIGISSIISPEDKLHYAQALLANGKYEESVVFFDQYNREKPVDSIAIRKLEGINNLSVFFEDSLSYPVKAVQINSVHADFSPVFYEQGIVFVSSRVKRAMIQRHDNRDNSSFFDLYYSTLNEESLSRPIHFDNKINNKLHEGPVVFSNNDQQIIFTSNNLVNKNGLKRLMLLSARKDDKGEWNYIKALPFNNENYSCGHPAISKDGKKLFFVSDMPGGYGGTDLYKSVFKDSSWTDPVNLGSSINTSADELFPYLQDDSLLYFSSKGYAGLGGLDIYMVEVQGEEYKCISNVGYPINSSQDDFGIAFSRDGKSGFFSSNREKGGNDDDIFSFKVIRIPVSGMVVGKLKGNSLKQVSIKLYEKEKLISTFTSTNVGEFTLNLNPGKEYTLEASKAQYKTLKTTLSTKGNNSHEPLKIKLELEKINKAFVNGIVKADSGISKAQIKIYYQEVGSGVVDTLRTDKNGQFHCEVDADSEYLFVAEKDGKAEVTNLKPPKRKRGAMLLIVNLQLRDYTNKTIKGVVKNRSNYNEGLTVIIKNDYTNQEDTLCTDKNGSFSFDAQTFAVYTISVLWGDKKATIKNFNPKKIRDPFIELYLKDDN